MGCDPLPAWAPHHCTISLGCSFRVSCQKIIAHKFFDHVVLVFIFLNCITIALERPDIDPGSNVRHLGDWMDGWGGSPSESGSNPTLPPVYCYRNVSSSVSPTTSSQPSS